MKNAGNWKNKKLIKDDGKLRLLILLMLFTILFLLLIRCLWHLQVIEGRQYAENYELKITKTIVEKGARGTIYDRNGTVLASNKLVYTITMTDSGVYETNREKQLSLNSMIYRLRKKLQQNGERLQNEITIMLHTDGSYQFTADGTALQRFKADIFGKTDIGDLTEEQSAMSAAEMVAYLSANDRFALYGTGKNKYTADELEHYGLPKEYTKEEILDIIGIRYMLSLYSYRKYQAVTIARNISPETMAFVLENKDSFLGIEVEEDWERVYEGGEAFAHILGYTGTISPKEREGKEEEYSLDSVVGKAGIEQYFETELRGIRGEKTVVVDNVGRIIEEGEVICEPAAGNDIYLSIDKDLQIAAYQILEQTLAGILSANLVNAKSFDKTKINDTTEIRIPVFDVYTAFIENGILTMEHMKQPEAAALEKEIMEKVFRRKEETRSRILSELTDDPHDFASLSEEMKEYLLLIAEDSGLIQKDALDKTDALYLAWSKGTDISPKDYFSECLKKGWIDLERFDQETKYATAEETYHRMVEYGLEFLQKSQEAEKILLKYLVLEGEISEQDVCILLYDQEIFTRDDDYEALLSGELAPFAFVKKKIRNMEITPGQLALDPCSASAVVVQKETGKILACVTYPGYDNNRLTNRMDNTYYNQLLCDLSLPLYNRATQQMTAPGSTLKPVTIIAGLEEGVILPDTSIDCDGVFDQVVPPLKCWKHSGHGTIENAALAIQNSCNDYLCDISYRLGQLDTGSYEDAQALAYLQEYASLFDLDQKSGVELIESSPHITEAYGIPSAIGQGTHNYTTVQLARYMNTLASRGNSFQLSVVKGIGDGTGTVTEREPVLQSRVELDTTTWDTVWQGMLLFAQNNSVLKDMKVTIAGKTGTAQESKMRPDHSLFIGYASSQKVESNSGDNTVPVGSYTEISLAVRIANGYSSSNATHAGRDMINYHFGLEDRDTILTGKASESSNSRSD